MSTMDHAASIIGLGVIARPIGDSLAFCPPLMMRDEDVDTMVDVLAHAIRDVG